MVVRGPQPLKEFFLMAEIGIVGVIAVEKGDAFDVIGNAIIAIDETKHATATAAMAAERDGDIEASEAFFNRVEDLGNKFRMVRVFAPPRGLAHLRAYEINDDDGAILDFVAEEAGLGADVLDGEMPVVIGF